MQQEKSIELQIINKKYPIYNTANIICYIRLTLALVVPYVVVTGYNCDSIIQQPIDYLSYVTRLQWRSTPVAADPLAHQPRDWPSYLFRP